MQVLWEAGGSWGHLWSACDRELANSTSVYAVCWLALNCHTKEPQPANNELKDKESRTIMDGLPFGAVEIWGKEVKCLYLRKGRKLRVSSPIIPIPGIHYSMVAW